MKGSYLMVSPDGRFFENISGIYRFSSPILDVGYGKAFSEIKVCSEKFHKRGGYYNWS
jgi:radical S-adenosyl methionine domain-containing protein 2